MFVRAVIPEGIESQAIMAPQQGVTRNTKGQPQSYVVDAEGKAQLRILTLDRAIGDEWLVTDGLEAGDRVIVEGLQKVRNGVEVKAVPFKAQGTPQASSGDTAQSTSQE
jgi:membrane fusion protein (multidrug efflux system)